MLSRYRVFFRYLPLLILSFWFSVHGKVIIKGIDTLDSGDIISEIRASILCDSDIYAVDEVCINKDANTIKDILDRHGYLDSTIKYEVNGPNIVFYILLGERYKIGFVGFGFNDTNIKFNMTVLQLYELAGIGYDEYFSNQVALGIGDSILDYLQQQGYIFAKMSKINVEHDDKTKYVRITYVITLGKKIVIGDTNINIVDNQYGERLVRFIRNRIQWKSNSLYSSRAVEDTKNILLEADLFKTIDVSLNKADKASIRSDADDESTSHVYDININATLLPSRKLHVFAGFNFDDLFSIGCGIKKYNIDSSGGYLNLDLGISRLSYDNNAKIDLSLYLRDLFGYRRDIDIHVATDKIAYSDMSVISNLNLIWQITKGLMCKVWASLEFFHVINKEKKYYVMGVPCVQVIYDGNRGDNRKFGFNTDVSICHYLSRKDQFVNIVGKIKLYIPVINNSFYNKFAVELHGGLGKIFGATREVPYEKRLFCGGDSSLRGYGDRMACDLSPVDNKPLGSTFMYEFGIESIIKMNKMLDLLLFVDGGNAGFARPFIGFGFGTRISTKLCNFRITIAFPLSIRKSSDDKRLDSIFQVQFKLENK